MNAGWTRYQGTWFLGVEKPRVSVHDHGGRGRHAALWCWLPEQPEPIETNHPSVDAAKKAGEAWLEQQGKPCAPSA